MSNLKYLFSIFLLFLLISPVGLKAQNCSGFEKKCQQAPHNFKASSQSRAFSLRKMKKVAIRQTLFANRQYFMSVCGKSKLGEIHIRVLADSPQREVLFDNAADNFCSQKTFQIETTIAVIIEISAPHFFEEQAAECAALFIAYKSYNPS